MEIRRRSVARHRAGRTGFATFEFLFVILGWAILIALLFPVLSKAREKARAGRCADSLRSIGGALSLYAADYDGHYPPAVVRDEKGDVSSTWVSLALPTTPPPCPEADMHGVQNRRVTPVAINVDLAGGPTASVRIPILTILACDARPGVAALSGPDTAGALQRPTTVTVEPDVAADARPAATRHGGGSNYLLADGHVRRLRPEQVGADGMPAFSRRAH